MSIATRRGSQFPLGVSARQRAAKRLRWLWLAFLLGFAAVPACQQADAPRRKQPEAERESEEPTTLVSRVEDGDTITLLGGRKVRYVGIDTPERGEPFHDEARAENLRLVGGQRVRFRVSGKETLDSYGRILGIVYLATSGDATEASVNVAMVRAGLANVYVKKPGLMEDRDLTALLRAQRAAIVARAGFWAFRLERAKSLRQPLVATRFRIHRRDCAEIRALNLPTVASLEEELFGGKSFCRSCKPLDGAE